MKPFAIWLAMVIGLFGGLGGGYHFYLEGHPRKMVVAIDASYPMKSVWREAIRALSELQDQRYTQFALFTEKSRVHSWSRDLDMENVTPYAPRNFASLKEGSAFPEIENTDKRLLITNAPAQETAELEGRWEILRLR